MATLTQELTQLTHAYERDLRALDRRIGEARSIAQDAKKKSTEVEVLSERSEALDNAVSVLSSYSEERQSSIQTQIEGIITHGLRAVFDNDLRFQIKTTKRGKQVNAEFVVTSKVDGADLVTDIMTARGGGVAAVVGFLLRLVLVLLRDDAMPVLFLDETFAQLSAEYEPALAEFLRELSDKTNIQIILVTHSTAFTDVADVQYRFTQNAKGVTQISKEV